MPFGLAVLDDFDYDAYWYEAISLDNPNSFYTTYYDEGFRRTHIIYKDIDLFKWSLNEELYVKCIPERLLHISQELDGDTVMRDNLIHSISCIH